MNLMREYLLLKDPEKLQQVEKDIQEKFRKYLPDDLSSENLRYMQEQRNEQKKHYYSKFILEGAPFSADDILKAKEEKRKRLDGGYRMTAEAESICRVALMAFLKVDIRGGYTHEAIKEALDEITKQWPRSLDSKTVRGWLDQILPETSLKRSPRGRPKKGR